jgi:hypothetical protein
MSLERYRQIVDEPESGLLPDAWGARYVECCIKQLAGGGEFRVEVLRVTRRTDLRLIGHEVVLALRPDTVVLWIGHDRMEVGTILQIPVEEQRALAASDVFRPLEITLQNATLKRFTRGAEAGTNG